MSTFESMLWARLGQVDRGELAQRDADATRPEHLARFATHIDMHRGLMLANAGDQRGGLAHAKAALAALLPEKRSQTLLLVLAEVQRAARR